MKRMLAKPSLFYSSNLFARNLDSLPINTYLTTFAKKFLKYSSLFAIIFLLKPKTTQHAKRRIKLQHDRLVEKSSL